MADSTENSLTFIVWMPEYNCDIAIINCQHKDTLLYLNRWFADIKLRRVNMDDPSQYLLDKIKYLKHFSCQHFSFEEDVMAILSAQYDFNSGSFYPHVAEHRMFSESLLAVLSEQIDHFIKCGNVDILNDLIVESLRDVAKWWYNHIAKDTKNGRPSFDCEYMAFIRAMSPDRKLQLLNDILTKIELSD